MASRLIEAFTVESDGGEQRVVACRERSIDASGLNSNESVWSGVSYFEFEDNGEIAYLQSDGTFQDGYGNAYRRVS